MRKVIREEELTTEYKGKTYKGKRIIIEASPPYELAQTICFRIFKEHDGTVYYRHQGDAMDRAAVLILQNLVRKYGTPK